MVRKTKANLEFENRNLKRKNFKLEKALNTSSKWAIGLTFYGLVTTVILVIVALS